MDLTLAQALETAEREYLCARVENLLQRADNPYGERVAGAALYSASNGIAYLGTAATCKHARGQGLHQALITHRIEQARAMGCQRVAATTLANAQSRRNLQRAGLIVSHAQALYRLAHP